MKVMKLSRSSALFGLATLLVLVFGLSVYAADSDTDWQTIQGMNKSVANSQNVIAACNRFIKAYPSDKRVQEAQKTIKDLSTGLLGVPALIRDKGIPVTGGVVVNLAGAGLFGGKIDLKKERSGLMAPDKPGQTPDTDTLEKRTIGVSKVKGGMPLSEVMTLLGNSDDMFEQADGNDYQKVLFYSLKGQKTAILWFDRADSLRYGIFVSTATTVSSKTEKESTAMPNVFLGQWVEKNGKSRIVVKSDSISWNREDEGTEIYAADKYKVRSGGQRVDLSATEIAYWNRETGEKPRRNISVTLTIEEEELIATIAPSQTNVSSSGLSVTSPPRRLVFKRQ